MSCRFPMKPSFAQLLVVLWTNWSAINSVRVLFVLLKASLVKILLTWSMNFGIWPSLGSFGVVASSFHFPLMDCLELRVTFRVQGYFLYSGLTCVESSLVFRMSLAQLILGPLRSTQIIWHLRLLTGGSYYQSICFSIILNKLEYFWRIIALNQVKTQIKLQFVRQQTIKDYREGWRLLRGLTYSLAHWQNVKWNPNGGFIFTTWWSSAPDLLRVLSAPVRN